MVAAIEALNTNQGAQLKLPTSGQKVIDFSPYLSTEDWEIMSHGGRRTRPSFSVVSENGCGLAWLLCGGRGALSLHCDMALKAARHIRNSFTMKP